MNPRLFATRYVGAFACAGCLLLAAPAFGTLPHAWSQRFGDTDLYLPDVGNSVAVDASGNVYVTGYFSRNALEFYIFVAKYNAAGMLQWSHQFGDPYTDLGAAGNSVAVDALGNVFVAGAFSGTRNFGGFGGLVSAGYTDIFVAKYSAAGVHQWSQRFGSTGFDEGRSVAVGASGDVFVTGIFYGTVNFGGGGLVSAGGYDIFVAKYNAGGAHQWSQRFGGIGDDYGNSIAVDASGNAFATGYFSGTVNFGGGGLVSAGGSDIFVAKYNAGGVHQWSQRFGSTGSDNGYSVAVDASGYLLVTGDFQGTVNLGGGTLVSAGGYDIFVAKYNAGGVHQWSQRFGSTNNDIGNSIAADASDNIFVTGSFNGTVNLGEGTLVSAGGSDIFVAWYNAAGVHQSSRSFGSTGADDGNSVASDASDNIFVTGYFDGTVNFGGGNLVSAGMSDIFVAKYTEGGPDGPRILAITDVGNDQGRLVKIRFARSGYDTAPFPVPVVQYEAYRRIDAPPAQSGIGGDFASIPGRERLDEGWTQVGTVAGHGQTEYTIAVSTIGDSTLALGQYYSVFFIRGATDNSFTFFDSPSDSGYSLDNLAPGVPAAFAYSAGFLSWEKSPATDFDYFTVYGSNTDAFGAATVVDYAVAPAMDVSALPYVFYYVTATDFSGNEGKSAKVNTLSGVGGTPGSYVLSISSYPNPFNPETTIRYTVPSKGRVTIEVYDARGTRVARLVGSEKEAGAYTQTWDGRGPEGKAVGSGVYFVRMAHPAGTRSYKIVLLK